MFKPTLRQLEYFCSLSRTCSFSKSAIECHIGQSTLSTAIKDLENGLNVILFERTSRRVFLTTEGEHLLSYAQNVLEHQETFLEQAMAFDNSHQAPIRLGIIPTIAPFLLTNLMNNDQNIHFTENLSANLLDDLEDRRIDVALIALPYPLKHHIKSRVLFRDELYLAKPKNNDSNDIPYIFLEDGHCLRDQAISSCQINAKNISNKFKATSLNSILSLVENGTGKTLIPKMSIPFFQTLKNVSFTPFSSSNAYREIALVWNNARHTNKINNLEILLTHKHI
jgi:LysR family hydrogen peroxide-inducible transcriptional activator